MATVSVTELPKQGQQVYALIGQGGPFAYDKDGVVFGNREQQLPKHKRGYYREYTVKTSACATVVQNALFAEAYKFSLLMFVITPKIIIRVFEKLLANLCDLRQFNSFLAKP